MLVTYGNTGKNWKKTTILCQNVNLINGKLCCQGLAFKGLLRQLVYAQCARDFFPKRLCHHRFRPDLETFCYYKLVFMNSIGCWMGRSGFPLNVNGVVLAACVGFTGNDGCLLIFLRKGFALQFKCQMFICFMRSVKPFYGKLLRGYRKYVNMSKISRLCSAWWPAAKRKIYIWC